MFAILVVIGIVWALFGMHVAKCSWPGMVERMNHTYAVAAAQGRRVGDRMRAWNNFAAYILAAVLYPPLLVLLVAVAFAIGRGPRIVARLLATRRENLAKYKALGWDDL